MGNSVPIAAHAPHTTGTKCCDQLLTSVKSLHCWHGGGEEGLAVTRKKSIASSELLFNSSTFLLPVLELFASTLFLKVNGSQKKSITSKSVVGRSGLIYHLPCFSSLTVRSILLFPWKKCEVWASPSSFFFSPPKVLAHPAPTWKMKPSDFCPYWALWPRPKIIVCARITSILRMPRKVGLSSGSLLLPTLQDKCVRFH